MRNRKVVSFHWKVPLTGFKWKDSTPEGPPHPVEGSPKEALKRHLVPLEVLTNSQRLLRRRRDFIFGSRSRLLPAVIDCLSPIVEVARSAVSTRGPGMC